MPLNYSIAMLPNPLKKEEAPKAYAKAQINGEVSLKELSKEISAKCTVHPADIYAVLIASVESLLTALKAGKQVDFGELGKFRLQICSKGAESAEKFSTSDIKGVNIQCCPAGTCVTSSRTWNSSGCPAAMHSMSRSMPRRRYNA